MSRLSEFYLNSKSSVAMLETLEISHPNFTQVYRVVRNHCEGITARIETGQDVFFQYLPMSIERMKTRDNLDFGLRITFGDLGEIIPNEIDAVIAAEGRSIKPAVKYRVYRSDDLMEALDDVWNLEMKQIGFTSEGCSFEASVPEMNSNGTGERSTMSRFSGQRGFL